LTLLVETILQRLFSTFANGWPGFGLAVQRFAIAAALFYCVFVHVSMSPKAAMVPHFIAATAGLLLLLGLWTPLAAAVIVVGELWVALERGSDPTLPLIFAAVASGLALIGPGAWSVDALLFGRKRI
jgi:putative oxidoreductase